MKLKTKLKRKRKEWVGWLLYGDEVNGKIDDKFEGIINHALEEHSIETKELMIEDIKKILANTSPPWLKHTLDQYFERESSEKHSKPKPKLKASKSFKKKREVSE